MQARAELNDHAARARAPQPRARFTFIASRRGRLLRLETGVTGVSTGDSAAAVRLDEKAQAQI